MPRVPGGYSDWDDLEEVEQDALVEQTLVKAREAVNEAISKSGCDSVELAFRLGYVHPTEVYNRLSGRRGMNVRTLAKMVLACGYDLRFEIVPLAKKEAK